MIANTAWLHELVVAPLAFALAALHARRALGAPRATVELTSLLLFGFALEWAAIRVFSSHSYGGGWIFAPLGVPVAVAAVWAALIVSVQALAARLGWAAPAARAAAAALLGIALDLLMEPVAVQAGLWRWTPPGPWLGVPIGNFVGWAVLVGGWTIGVEVSGQQLRGLRLALARAALAGAVVMALLGVGLGWQVLAAERLLEGRAGWVVWAVLLAMAAGLRQKPAAASGGGSLASRLATAPGSLPNVVVALILAAFAGDALRLGGPLMVVAAGSTLALALPLLATIRDPGPDAVLAERVGGRARTST